MSQLANVPLRDIRVIELGHFVAAPSLGSLLAFLGAEVIKIEPPGGEISRIFAPWSFFCFGFNKKSICIDLRQGEGRRIFYDLARSSDVLIENLSPSALRSLGISYSDVALINPRMIYCSIKGFASDSSKAERPAFDTIAQAESGLMSTLGHEDDEPIRINNPCIDLGAAAYAATAILAALMMREKMATGQYIEVSLLDVALYWNSYWIAYYSFTGKEPARLGSGHAAYSPYGVYKVKDGYVFIGAITDQQWEDLCQLLGIKKIEGLESMKSRVEKRSLVDELVSTKIASMNVEEIVSLIANKVPCSPVRSVRDVVEDEELIRRGILRRFVSDGHIVKIISHPIRMDLLKPPHELPPPEAGRDTREILLSLGYSQERIATLIKDGIVK